MYDSLIAAGRAEERELVRVQRDGPRARVTLAEPERLNPLSAGLTVQLQDALAELVADSGVRTIVLTGEDPAFCAGGDLDMITEGSRAVRSGSDTTEPRGGGSGGSSAGSCAPSSTPSRRSWPR